MTGNAAKVAAEIAEKELELIKKLMMKFRERKQLIWDSLARRSDAIDGECSHYAGVAELTLKNIKGKVSSIQKYETRVMNFAQTRKECEDGTAIGNVTLRRDRMHQFWSDVSILRWEVREFLKTEFDEDISLETKSSAQLAPKMNAMVAGLRDIKMILAAASGGSARECIDQIDDVEDLNKKRMYTKVLSRVRVALVGCSAALEEAGLQTTTTTKKP
jgi:hypothetical protein